MQVIEVGYIDGCFDLAHVGHFRIIAQAGYLCNKLIVGVHSDAEIELYKQAPPVVREAERYALIERIGGVDSILPGAPYEPSLEFLDGLGADVCFHGEDVPLGMHGASAYEAISDAKRLVILKRTDCISTTDMISHLMRQVVLDVFTHYSFQTLAHSMQSIENMRGMESVRDVHGGTPPPKVVYVQGSFDMLHAGHVQFLEDAAKRGNWLVAGVTTAGNVESLPTRIFKVAACKSVCDVIIVENPVISENFLRFWNVDLVIRGSGHGGRLVEGCDYTNVEHSECFMEIVSKWPDLCSSTWSDRVHNNYGVYVERQRKKASLVDSNSVGSNPE